LGFKIYATTEASKILKNANNISHLTREESVKMVMSKSVDFVVNIPAVGLGSGNDNENYLVRRTSVDFNIPLVTNLQIAEFIVESLVLNPGVKTQPYSYYLKHNEL